MTPPPPAVLSDCSLPVLSPARGDALVRQLDGAPAIAFSALQGGLGLHQLGAGRFQSRLCVDDIARSRALSGLLGGLSCRYLRAKAVNHGGSSTGLRFELRGIEYSD